MGPRIREDKKVGECGRFPNLHYEGLAAQHITGDHKGRPYEGRMGAGMGMGPRMREDKRGVHPHPFDKLRACEFIRRTPDFGLTLALETDSNWRFKGISSQALRAGSNLPP